MTETARTYHVLARRLDELEARLDALAMDVTKVAHVGERIAALAAQTADLKVEVEQFVEFDDDRGRAG